MKVMAMTIKPTKNSIKKAPQITGVYLFMAGKTPVYIGKAVNLRARLLSHLENAKLDLKERAIFENSTSIKLLPAESEFKALILEARLIQKYLPRYNQIWKDDKSYLYVVVDRRERYPRVRGARKHDMDGVNREPRIVNREGVNSVFAVPYSRFYAFGPFPSTRVVSRILKEVRRIVPYCDSKGIGAKPCFHSKIGLCKPCPNIIEQISDAKEKKHLAIEYRNNIRAIVKIFEGKTDAVLKRLYRELKSLSAQEKYEEALMIRNRIYLFEKFVSEHGNLEQEGLETFGVRDARRSLLKILQKFFPRLARLDRIECYDISNISQKQGTAAMVVATGGLIDKSQYRKFRIKNKKLRSDFEMLREVMGRRFRNISPPLQGGVRGGNVAPTPSSAKGGSASGGNSPSGRGRRSWSLPDLVIVDGGRPQVRILQKVFAEKNIAIPIIGIAKNPDRLVMAYREAHIAKRENGIGSRSATGDRRFATLRPPLNHAGFNLVRTLRDEAHRFSKKYHLLLRTRAFFGER